MFIREVVKQNKGYKRKFIYHQLVESFRTDRGPRQRILLNMGRVDLPKENWKALANRIEEILSHQRSFIPVDPEIEPFAQHYASVLIEKGLRFVPDQEGAEADYEQVDIHSIKTRNARAIGAEHVSLSQLRRLGIGCILKGLGFTERQIQIGELLIVGRMVYPASEWRTYEWANHLSAIGELLPFDIGEKAHNQLYTVSDRLLRHKADIESRLRRREQSLFCLDEKIILYDLTNTYFESGIGKSSLKRYGPSKDKRRDSALIALGLVLDEDGFIKGSQIFRGNIAEVKTLVPMIDKLAQDDCSGQEKTVIMDAGLASEDNLKQLRAKGYHYICVSRNKPIEQLSEEGFVVIRHNQENKVEARLYREGEEFIVFCRSLLRSKKEEAMRTRFQERFEADLYSVLNGLHKKGGTKSYPKVLERIGRLKQKHARIASYYEIEVKETNGNAIDLNWKLREDKNLDDRFSGTYYLRSSRMDLDEKQIWSLYVMLTDLEDSFRSMKSELGLRPNFHQKDRRIKGHVFITILAYHVVNSIQRKLHARDIYLRWDTIRKFLSSQVRVTTEMITKDGSKIWIRNTSEPEAFHLMVARALSIREKPLANQKLKKKNL